MNLSKDSKVNKAEIVASEKTNKKIIKFYATEENISIHKKMVSKIKDPVWKKYTY